MNESNEDRLLPPRVVGLRDDGHLPQRVVLVRDGEVQHKDGQVATEQTLAVKLETSRLRDPHLVCELTVQRLVGADCLGIGRAAPGRCGAFLVEACVPTALAVGSADACGVDRADGWMASETSRSEASSLR